MKAIREVPEYYKELAGEPESVNHRYYARYYRLYDAFEETVFSFLKSMDDEKEKQIMAAHRSVENVSMIMEDYFHIQCPAVATDGGGLTYCDCEGSACTGFSGCESGSKTDERFCDHWEGREEDKKFNMTLVKLLDQMNKLIEERYPYSSL